MQIDGIILPEHQVFYELDDYLVFLLTNITSYKSYKAVLVSWLITQSIEFNLFDEMILDVIC